MRDAQQVDAQLFQPDIPVRLDMRTAALVEHALALQEMAGTGAAALFLHCHDVPLATALRVLTTGPRRQLAGPHLFARLRPRTGARQIFSWMLYGVSKCLRIVSQGSTPAPTSIRLPIQEST